MFQTIQLPKPFLSQAHNKALSKAIKALKDKDYEFYPNPSHVILPDGTEVIVVPVKKSAHAAA